MTSVATPAEAAPRTYAYDLRGDLTRLDLPSDPHGAHTAYEYDAACRRTSVTLPDGSARAYAYDPAGRLASIVTTMSSGVLAHTYERDAAGNVTAENAERYAYDALGRLTQWYSPSAEATTTYTYDSAGNLLSAARGGEALKTFTYDAANRISSPGYAYDARGNLTASPGRTYAYDGADRLTAVIDASTETTIAAYTYDFLNRRTSATEGTATVFFHYDGASPNVIAETDAAGETIATYAYDDTGQLHSMTRDGATYYYHANHRGDVVAMTDVDGDVVNTYAYDPYGEVLSAEETVENPYRYAGYRYDEPTGLYYLWNRYYDPETCRFLTRDPYPGELDSPMSMNPYLYCLGDPVNLVDPTGWCAENRLSDSWRLSTPTDTDWAFMLAGSLCDLLGLVGLIAPPAGWAFFAAGVAMDVANIQRVLGLRSEDRATRGDVIAAVAGIMPGVTPYTAQMHMMQGFGQWITPWDTGFYAHP